jgi:hypothetical protein
VERKHHRFYAKVVSVNLALVSSTTHSQSPPPIGPSLSCLLRPRRDCCLPSSSLLIFPEKGTVVCMSSVLTAPDGDGGAATDILDVADAPLP